MSTFVAQGSVARIGLCGSAAPARSGLFFSLGPPLSAPSLRGRSSHVGGRGLS